MITNGIDFGPFVRGGGHSRYCVTHAAALAEEILNHLRFADVPQDCDEIAYAVGVTGDFAMDVLSCLASHGLIVQAKDQPGRVTWKLTHTYGTCGLCGRDIVRPAGQPWKHIGQASDGDHPAEPDPATRAKEGPAVTGYRKTTEQTYPRWIQAGDHDIRVEVAYNQFVDYARYRPGEWRQMTRPMTHEESIWPGSCQLGDRPDLAALRGCDPWPVVDDEMAAWLDKTMKEITR